MSYTYFEAQVDLARVLMDVWEGVATGGTTTTVIDTVLNYPDGYFSDNPRGTLFLDLATDAVAVITGHSSQTITFAPAQAGAVAANDIYYAAPGVFPKHIIEQSVKMGLKRIGKIPFAKDVAAVVDQQEWDSDDDTVFTQDIVGVEFAANAAAPFNFTPHYRWNQYMLSSKKTLVFNEGALPTTTNNMRIFYLDDHEPLTSLDDEISSFVNPDRLTWTAAIHALRWRIQRIKQVADTSEQDGALMTEAKANLLSVSQEQLAEAEQQAVTLAQLFPIDRQKTPHHARW
jgi:hypothetical protein